MKRVRVFFGLFVKRLLKKPSFLVILIMMPLLVLAFRLIIKEDSSSVYIALYSEDKSPLINEALDELVNSDSRLSFYIADSEIELREAVLTNDAECGFFIQEGFLSSLLEEKAEDMVIIYKNTKTTLDDLGKEMLFASIFKRAAYDRVVRLLDDKGFFEEYAKPDRAEAENYIKEKYAAYMEDGGIFEIVYSENGSDRVTNAREAGKGSDYLMRPVRGVAALFMMIAAMAGAVFREIDEKNGVYKTLGYTERPFINILTVLIPVLLSALAALLSLYAGGIAKPGDLPLEILRLLLYALLLTAFANLLRSLIKSEALLCSILPMLTVVSLLGCNIFFNAAAMVRGIRQLRYILPPDYYLERTGDIRGIAATAIVSGLMLIAAVIKDRKSL